jgi:hypothetical protein
MIGIKLLDHFLLRGVDTEVWHKLLGDFWIIWSWHVLFVIYGISCWVCLSFGRSSEALFF